MLHAACEMHLVLYKPLGVAENDRRTPRAPCVQRDWFIDRYPCLLWGRVLLLTVMLQNLALETALCRHLPLKQESLDDTTGLVVCL